jgi:23S rRNA (cytosine1962-C5)-methyltransferase
MKSVELPLLYLRRNEERRLRLGHPWVYSNEVDVVRSPLPEFSAGDVVEVRAHNDRPLGSAYVNPQTLISARLFSRRAAQPLDPNLLARRIREAQALRERLFAVPYYRLIFGESDGLPGLVVDRYGDGLVVQIGTAGMERVRGDILAVLQEALSPKAVVLRNDTAGRRLEGLPGGVEIWLGDAPDRWELEENGTRFRFSPIHGQKTGWFLDHRQNRKRLGSYVKGARVLDVFSYLGAWGVQAAALGAAEVVCVDASESALAEVAANAALNGLSDRVRTVAGDAFRVLKDLAEAGERFDVVVVDPPAFIKRKKDLRAGGEAYQRLNRLAMRLVTRDGFLISSSCSYRLSSRMLRDLLWGSARHVDRRLQILEQGHQAPDHPIHPALPESAYLKCITARVFQ